MFGIIIALSCAFTWSLSVVLLKQISAQVHPSVLNLGKNTLGLMFLIPTAFLIDGPFPNVTDSQLLILFLSGFFGIGIADAFVLKAMGSLSASRIAVLECLFAPFVIALSIIFLDESLNLQQVFGALAIGASLVLVLPKRGQEANSGKGALFMVAGLLTMAGGILVVKPLFDQLPLFWIVAIRMVAGVVGSILPFAAVSNKGQELQKLVIMEKKIAAFLAFFLSAYISIILWLAGYKYLQATIASVLNQTSTIFTVILAVLILKEEFTPKKAAATILATVGVVIMSAH